MKKFLIFLTGLIIGIILFMPKENLFYSFENFLKKKDVYINSDINSNIALNLKNGTLYYEDIDIAAFEKIKVLPFIFYNKIEAENVKLNIKDYKIYFAKIIYSVFNPFKVFIKAKGSFGKIDGEINLLKKYVKIYIYNLSDSSLKKFLRKDNKGYFYYAKF